VAVAAAHTGHRHRDMWPSQRHTLDIGIGICGRRSGTHWMCLSFSCNRGRLRGWRISLVECTRDIWRYIYAVSSMPIHSQVAVCSMPIHSQVAVCSMPIHSQVAVWSMPINTVNGYALRTCLECLECESGVLLPLRHAFSLPELPF